MQIAINNILTFMRDKKTLIEVKGKSKRLRTIFIKKLKIMLIGILKMKIKWNNKKEIYSYVKTLDHHKVFTLNS